MTSSQLDPNVKDPAIVNGVDTYDVPSAAWGWSGKSVKASRIAGWVVAVFLLLMLIGNHRGRVEDIYLISFTAVIIITLIGDIFYRRAKKK